MLAFPQTLASTSNRAGEQPPNNPTHLRLPPKFPIRHDRNILEISAPLGKTPLPTLRPPREANPPRAGTSAPKRNKNQQIWSFFSIARNRCACRQEPTQHHRVSVIKRSERGLPRLNVTPIPQTYIHTYLRSQHRPPPPPRASNDKARFHRFSAVGAGHTTERIRRPIVPSVRFHLGLLSVQGLELVDLKTTSQNSGLSSRQGGKRRGEEGNKEHGGITCFYSEPPQLRRNVYHDF